MSNKGIIYVAFGWDYLLMSAYSAKTAKNNNPNFICQVVTNIKHSEKMIDDSPFDIVTFVEKDQGDNRLIKTNIIKYAQFDKVIYLDCDTKILADLNPLFDFLDYFDMALKLNPSNNKVDYNIYKNISLSEFSVWNGGMFCFKKNNKTRNFFKNWTQKFREEKMNRDQLSLSKTLFRADNLRILSLNSAWNTFPQEVDLLINGLKDSKIWHYRYPRRNRMILKEINEIGNIYLNNLEQINEINKIKDIQKKNSFFSFFIISKLYKIYRDKKLEFIRKLIFKTNIIKVTKKIIKKMGIADLEEIRESKTNGENYELFDD